MLGCHDLREERPGRRGRVERELVEGNRERDEKIKTKKS